VKDMVQRKRITGGHGQEYGANMIQWVDAPSWPALVPPVTAAVAKDDEKNVAKTKASETKKAKATKKKATKQKKDVDDDDENDDDDDEDDEDGVYEVESISDSKMVAGQRMYLVKWLGYDDNMATWEPESNLDVCHAPTLHHTIIHS
jgi:hypothetical protein